MKKIFFIAAVILLMVVLHFYFIQDDFAVKMVAHAGGGIDGKAYTDSIDALDLNLKKGFTYFELDFVLTSDNNLVCMHGWNYKTQSLASLETRPEIRA